MPIVLGFHSEKPQMPLSGNSAVGLAYKSGGLGVPGSNPGCPIGVFAVFSYLLKTKYEH